MQPGTYWVLPWHGEMAGRERRAASEYRLENESRRRVSIGQYDVALLKGHPTICGGTAQEKCAEISCS